MRVAQRRGLRRAIGSMAAGTTLSRATGVLRVLVLAYVLGISPLADAFNLANTIPNMLYDIVLGGVLGATFIPVLIERLATRPEREAWRSISAVMTVAVVVLARLCADGFTSLWCFYAALASGATRGYVYIRSEYPHAVATMTQAVQLATQAGFLGDNVLGSGRQFHLEVRKAAGSYVCGEETAMLESIEGKRGVVRAKPPIPALQGLFNQPTVINNVITFASVPIILARGAQFYRNYGVGRSHGTLPLQLTGNVKYGGLIEKAFGVTLRTLIYEFGGGSASGRPVKAVQVGGPLGSYVPESQWDVPLDYEAYAAMGATVGHGGIVVHDDTADLARLARYAMEFCAVESCGKCTPCRIGSTRGVEVMDRILRGENRTQQVTLLRDLCDTMVHGSLCAMGSMTPNPVLSALAHYPADFGLDAPATKAA